MILLAPWALWLSLVGAAVVALYLLKIKRRRQTVPALDFWLQLAGQTQVRSLFQRLKRWLSLALWLLIVACLVLAVGDPVFSLGRVKPESIAIIIDNSASMTTLEPRKDAAPCSRWALALDAISQLTTRRPVSDEWLLIESGRLPRVRVPWTMDRRSVREAAAAIPSHLGATDLRAAHELAVQLLTGKERPRIVLISDGAAGHAAALAQSDPNVVPWMVGGADDNLGMTGLAVRENREQAMHHALISLINATTAHVDTQVVLSVDGATTSVEPVSIDAGMPWEKTVAINAPQGGVLHAWIDRPDALAADNEAYAVLSPISRATVLLVTPPKESFFYEQALAAMEPLVDADASRTLTIAEYDALMPAASTQAAAPAADLTIFNNCRPARLPPLGQFVFVNDWPAEVPARVTGTMEQPQLSIALRDHPLCRYVNAAAVGLARAKRVELPDRAAVLARAEDGAPLVFLVQQPQRAMLCLAFDVLESDLPFRNAFPLLLRNAVSYLVSQRAAWIHPQYRVGDLIEPLRALPLDITSVQVADSAGESRPIAVAGGRFTFEQTQRIGPLRFTMGNDSVYTAINLTDADESRITPVKSAKSPHELLSLSDRLLGTAPWLALAMLATALVALEWLTYHLRWTE